MIGLGLGLAAALFWAIANAFIGPASRQFGSLGALIWAQLFGGCMIVVVAFIVEGPPPLPDTFTALVLLLGALAATVAYGALFESFRCGQLSTVAPLVSSWSVITVATGLLVFDESLAPLTGLGVALAVFGNILLARYRDAGVHDEDTSPKTPRRALVFAILSALAFGMMVPCVEVVGAGIGRLWVVPMLWATELMFLLGFLRLRNDLPPRPQNRRDALILGRVGFFEVAGFLSMSLALSAAPMSVVSPAGSLATGFSVMIGVLVLKEQLSRPALVGAVLASMGVVLLGM